MTPPRRASEEDRLDRFVIAQDRIYPTALEELKRGRKESHWMWFIFPQMRGLGYSSTSNFYGIASMDEARRYLEHLVLGPRLRECIGAVNRFPDRSAGEIFGPDEMKLRSCATLFLLAGGGAPFEQCLKTFFNAAGDPRTIECLRARSEPVKRAP